MSSSEAMRRYEETYPPGEDYEEARPLPVCPLHGLEMVVPCQARGCDAWVPGHRDHCGLVALQGYPQDELPWSTLGQLLQLESVVVERLARQAYEALRSQEIEATLPTYWGLIRDSQRCVVCLGQGTIHEQGWSWCSPACAEWLPARLVAIEARWGTRLAEIIRRHPTLRSLQKVIQLSRTDLCWLAWQHAGINIYPEGTDPPPLKPNPSVPTSARLLARVRRSQLWRNQ